MGGHVIPPPPVPTPDVSPDDTVESVSKKRRTDTPVLDLEVSERRISTFVVVCWNTRAQKWAAQSRLHGKTIYLGYFTEEEDAARKYDEHAIGIGRPLNFPKTPCQLQAWKRAPRAPRGSVMKSKK